MISKDRPFKQMMQRAHLTRILSIGAAIISLIGMLVILPADVSWDARATIAILIFGLVLWALEPIPLGMTSVLTIIMLLLFNAVTIETALTGFASPAVFLIIAGMMMAKGVGQTSLMNRVTYALLAKWGHSAKGAFLSIFYLMQFQAFFIPATAVRVTLIMPIVLTVLESVGAKKDSRLNKLMLVGAAFAGNISGTAILTAAIGNILAVEILQLYLGVTFSYFDWFLYAFPIWILLMIAIPYILWRCFPPEEFSFRDLQHQMKEKNTGLGTFSVSEKKCVWILCLTVLLWMTQPLHGYHPTIPALLAVVLMASPGIGFADWKKIVNVNFDLVLLVGATLSLGYALIESGAIDLLAQLFTADWVLQAFQEPWIALLLVVLIAQIYHLGVTNVATAIVTLLPLLIGLSQQAGLDPVVITYAGALTTLFGYILVVETMPNVVAHATGLIEQRDFYLPGILATAATTVITLLVAYTWWNWLGFWP